MGQLCVACKSEIEDGATKCVHCDSFQNWRRYLVFGNTVLALLVALISVSALAIPVFINALHEERSDVRIRLVSIGFPDTKFWVWNTGDKPGLLLSVTLRSQFGSRACTFSDSERKMKSAVIEPDHFNLYSFSVAECGYLANRPLSGETVTLAFKLVPYEGRPSTIVQRVTFTESAASD